MLSIFRSRPEEKREFVIRSREGWWLTLLPPDRQHKACRFTDKREAEDVAKALSGHRRHFAAYEIVEVIPNDPRFNPPR